MQAVQLFYDLTKSFCTPCSPSESAKFFLNPNTGTVVMLDLHLLPLGANPGFSFSKDEADLIEYYIKKPDNFFGVYFNLTHFSVHLHEGVRPLRFFDEIDGRWSYRLSKLSWITSLFYLELSPAHRRLLLESWSTPPSRHFFIRRRVPYLFSHMLVSEHV